MTSLYERLDKELSLLNSDRFKCDSCVYIHKIKQIIIGVYVDDLVICGKLTQQVLSAKAKLQSIFPIIDLKEIGTVIGWKITRDRSTRTLKISRSNYLSKNIKSFGLQDANACISPIDGYIGINPAQNNEPLADESAYANAVGSLGYASNSIRLDRVSLLLHLN